MSSKHLIYSQPIRKRALGPRLCCRTIKLCGEGLTYLFMKTYSA